MNGCYDCLLIPVCNGPGEVSETGSVDPNSGVCPGNQTISQGMLCNPVYKYGFVCIMYAGMLEIGVWQCL